MKKVVGFMLVIGVFFMMIYFTKKETAQSVFNINEDEYDMYQLTLSLNQLNTNQLESLFKDMNIISLSPFINPLYENKIKSYRYSFETVSVKENIQRFIKYHIALLNNNYFKQDALYAEVNGVYIKEMIVYGTLNQLRELQNDIKFTYFAIM